MFVYIVYNLVMLLFFFFISLPFMVNKRFSKVAPFLDMGWFTATSIVLLHINNFLISFNSEVVTLDMLRNLIIIFIYL